MEPPVVLSDDAIPSDVSDETVAVGFLPPGEAGKISDATGTFWYPFYDVLSNGWFSVCCGVFGKPQSDSIPKVQVVSVTRSPAPN